MLGSVFNAFEFDFAEEIVSQIPGFQQFAQGLEKNIVLLLAICDHDSPLAWSILAHELGHAIDNKAELSKRAMSKFARAAPQSRDMLTNWSRELAADAIASRVLGPAALLALVSMSYCLVPGRPTDAYSKAYPATSWRLNAVKTHARLLADIAGEEFDEYPSAVESLSQYLGPSAQVAAEAQRPSSMYRELVAPLADAIYADLDRLDLRPFNGNGDSLARCKIRLEANLPIGAQGLPRKELRDEIKAYKGQGFAARQDQVKAFEKLANKFAEEPLDPGTILTAGALRRHEALSAFCDRPTITRRDVEEHCATLARLDALLASSIRSSSIQRQLKKGSALV